MIAPISLDPGAVQSYLKVFHLIFKLAEHEAHHKMMRRKTRLHIPTQSSCFTTSPAPRFAH